LANFDSVRSKPAGAVFPLVSSADAFESAAEVQAVLGAYDYIADEALSVSVFLAGKLGRPLLVEGAPGVGKTELAKVVSRALGTDLIRLQCYEGLDLAHAAYEWNYPRQLLEIQARGMLRGAVKPSTETPSTETPNAAGAANAPTTVDDLFSERYLLRRPLLDAIDPSRERAPVLLIDELDRADEEFESFLLELLSDFQITIPELGTVRAVRRPFVLLTSNRTREVHDALRRRCLYQWIDYPSADKEKQILDCKVPGLGDVLGRQIVEFAERLRAAGLYKAPGVAESVDWARALMLLGVSALDLQSVRATLGCLVKHRDDVERLSNGLAEALLERASGS